MTSFRIRRITPGDRQWIVRTLTDHWGSPQVVSRGRIYDADRLPGFIAVHKRQPAGLVTYHIEMDECQITTLHSLVNGIGIGTGLIEAVKTTARKSGCCRIWLITTNDNTGAIRFYQKRGFHFLAIHRKAIQRSRELKPSIPILGYDGIPIRDEIEFELFLRESPTLSPE